METNQAESRQRWNVRVREICPGLRIGSRKVYIISHHPSFWKFCRVNILNTHQDNTTRPFQPKQFTMPFTSDIDDAQDVAFSSLPIGSTEAPVPVLRDDLHSPKSHLPVSATDSLAACGPSTCSRPLLWSLPC